MMKEKLKLSVGQENAEQSRVNVAFCGSDPFVNAVEHVKCRSGVALGLSDVGIELLVHLPEM